MAEYKLAQAMRTIKRRGRITAPARRKLLSMLEHDYNGYLPETDELLRRGLVECSGTWVTPYLAWRSYRLSYEGVRVAWQLRERQILTYYGRR